jgi:hypothetical protein
VYILVHGEVVTFHSVGVLDIRLNTDSSLLHVLDSLE